MDDFTIPLILVGGFGVVFTSLYFMGVKHLVRYVFDSMKNGKKEMRN